uniref:Auxin-induced protein n=1 Tax=Lotus japonicus TaxID=34305 RepID=I3S1W8_LOTJA|nr:unknown [Lotus japonicus]
MQGSDENMVLSSEDSSSPDETECHLQLGLSLSLSPYATSSLSSRSWTSSHSHSVLTNNAPTSQVVGWPPLRAYRMNSYNSHAKSQVTEVFNSMVENSKANIAVVRKSSDNGSVDNSIIGKENRNPRTRSSLFVKVKMDGVPIGRKVDLSAHSSYETLAQSLEDMFNEPNTVLTCKVGLNGVNHGIIAGADRHSKLFDGSSNSVLTYEDKEGDWMLVGDVPWWMFISSVRRLRIMRTSEANGLDWKNRTAD